QPINLLLHTAGQESGRYPPTPDLQVERMNRRQEWAVGEWVAGDSWLQLNDV
ncbi:MAG: hypothetical protein RLY82_136, partial [Pseudomonadota bacterium]